LRLLADKAVELEIVPTICHETVRQVLKKRTETLSSPQQDGILPEHNADC
jgi:hypothetical protein